MSTTSTLPATAPGASAPGGALSGTATLIRFILRRDRIRIPAWLAAIALVQVTAPSTYEGLYPTEADRLNQAAVVGDNPAMKAMTGPGHGIPDAYTYGAMISNEYLGFMVIFVALMSMLMVTRHTRAEEESGRAELVRAGPVGRHAALAAALITVSATNVLLGLLIALGMGASGVQSISWAGSFVFGAAFTAVGLVFTAVAAVTAQITRHSRAAAGMAGALIAVAYVVRAIGDVGGNGLSWLSPIGWAQASAPYVDDNWWPIALAVGVAAVLAAAAFMLSMRRDIDAGLRAERAGAAVASPFLGTPIGFAWRLQRSALIWWTVAMAVAGLGYGSVVDVMQDYADNQTIQDILGDLGGTTITESWLSMIIAVIAIVCTIFSIIAALRPRREETSGRAELALATGLSRTRWVGTHLVIALIGGAVLLLASGIGLGIGAAEAMSDPAFFWEVLGATLAYAPALWLTTGLAVVVFGLRPRATGLAWALLGYAIFVVYLGGLLRLPAWLQNLSPYTHVPRMPAADFTPLPLAALTAIAAGLIAVGLIGFRRRDVDAT